MMVTPLPSAGHPPSWWEQARQELALGDPVMGDLVRRAGERALVSRGDPFHSLARSIVGQQVSVKAAQSVWDRLGEGVGSISASSIRDAAPSTLRSAGLSGRKAEYLADLAVWFSEGEAGTLDWNALDDEDVIECLAERRGIGRWTAEMFLIFCLLRPDVLPVGDLGLLRAARQLYPGEADDADAVLALGQRWKPWRSAATWFLWRHLDPVPVTY